MTSLPFAISTVVLVLALVITWTYFRFGRRGAVLTAIVTLAITLPLIQAWRQSGPGPETPIVLDMTIALVAVSCMVLTAIKAGPSVRGFARRAILTFAAGMLALFASSFVAYVGWIWMS